MQYHAMLMYTSCGWFFDEVTGIESMQDIFYATRAVQLAEEISGEDYEPEFIESLKKIPSNLPEYGTAYAAYEEIVKPMELDMIRIGAHYAISSLFEEFPEEITLYNFSATVKTSHYYEAGKQKLIVGRTEFRSRYYLGKSGYFLCRAAYGRSSFIWRSETIYKSRSPGRTARQNVHVL